MRKLLLHGAESGGKTIFSGDNVHIGKMINFLLMGHPLQKLVGDTGITPLDIPYFRLCKILYSPIESLNTTYFSQNRIFCICIDGYILVRLMVTGMVLFCFYRSYF